MTYLTKQKIQATDYNNIAWTNPSVGGHLGIGTGDHGLGQNTSNIPGVPSGTIATIPQPPGTYTKITAVQWQSLIAATNICLNHHGQAPISVPPATIVAGSVVQAFEQIAEGSQRAYNSAGTTSNLADALPFITSYNNSWGTIAHSPNKTLELTQTLTFASGDAARYFFNAGGKVKLTFSHTGGVTPINDSWTVICQACGTLSFGYRNTTKIGGSGGYTVPGLGAGGYWAGTPSYVEHFHQNDVAGSYYYSSDYVSVKYKWGGIPSNGGYPVLYIKTSMVNASGSQVDGTASVAMVVSSPTTAYLPAASWATPTAPTPATFSVGLV